MYTGFCGITALNLLPLIKISSMAVIADATLATSVSMSTFAAIAYNSPTEQYLMYGGSIGIVSSAAVIFACLGATTGSALSYNIWLYGGLALSGVYVMYDTQMIM